MKHSIHSMKDYEAFSSTSCIIRHEMCVHTHARQDLCTRFTSRYTYIHVHHTSSIWDLRILLLSSTCTGTLDKTCTSTRTVLGVYSTGTLQYIHVDVSDTGRYHIPRRNTGTWYTQHTWYLTSPVEIYWINDTKTIIHHTCPADTLYLIYTFQKGTLVACCKKYRIL